MYKIANTSACARFQVNPKNSHLHAVKKIFRYLKGQPKLGLWYPKDLPFDLVAYTDTDYAGVSLDRKSTRGGYQFLGCRLISWQCKKQTVVANSTTEVEYIAASNCCGQLQSLVDGKKVIITETSVRRDLHLEVAEAHEEIGEGSTNPTDPYHTPIITQPSTSQPQKKQPRRKQKKNIESKEEGLKEVERGIVKNFQGFKRLKEVGSARKGKKIADIDADAEDVVKKEVSTADPVTTAGKVVTTASVEVSNVEVAIDSATTTTVDELTLAQTLIKIKAAKLKVRGVMIQEPSEFTTTTTTTTTPAASKPLQNKGKAKIT
ncbi:hypothetical protein Tco_0712465 [Tanacetum coccineum]